jgi:hypothetical protein
MLEQFTITLISIIASIAGTTGVFLILLFLFPGKVEQWQAIIWGWIDSAGLLYKRANKERIRHSIQGDVTEFTRELSRELPQFNAPGVKIEWIEQAESRKAFIENGRAVIRLRRNDQNNENIVSACLMFVSQILLRRPSRYLSPTQRQAVELFVGFKFLERQPEEIFDTFIDKWLYPGIEKGNEKTSEYFERFKTIDKSQFFLPIFLQELVYMGEKVFNRKRDDTIVKEVEGALHFLELHAARKIGEKIDSPYFNGDACRFAIMIIGIPSNINEERYDIYLKHIREQLLPCNIETIYLIGSIKNTAFMREIAERVSNEFYSPFSKNYNVLIHGSDGQERYIDNFLLVLRRKQLVRYIS